MARAGLWSVGALALAGLTSAAMAGDMGPPNFPGYSWNRSDPHTTFVKWTFGGPGTSGGNYFFPDEFLNPGGPAQVVGTQTTATPSTIPDENGRDDAVWCINPGQAFVVTIPNMLDITHPKDIFVQYKWWAPAGVGGEPVIMAMDPSGLMAGPGPVVCTPSTIGEAPPFTLYSGCVSLVLPYCPEFEVIKVTNPNPSAPIYLTQLVVDTRCIPSPGAGAALALAGGVLGARRRRRDV